MKKILLSVVLLATTAALVLYSTYAWFVSRATANDNVFETGELIIGAPNKGANSGFISAHGLVPGGSVSESLEVKNLGDIDFKYKVKSTRHDGNESLYNALELTIKRGDAQIYNGLLMNLEQEIGTIDKKESETLTFTVLLPTNAPNSCQGQIAIVDFIFDATQIESNEWLE